MLDLVNAHLFMSVWIQLIRTMQKQLPTCVIQLVLADPRMNHLQCDVILGFVYLKIRLPQKD